MSFSLNFPCSLTKPEQQAGFRTEVEDFVVDESLGFDGDGEGEHILLRLRKVNQNTRWVAAALAEYYGIDEQLVGYCGLKDRRAVTTQWFSLQYPKGSLPAPAIPGCEIIEQTRHRKKLRPGMHQLNRFAITLRFEVDAKEDVEQRLNRLVLQGFPNYFGEQRFGLDGNNLRQVAEIVARKSPRFRGRRGGLYLSSARSWLFNLVLSQRIVDGSWLQVADGPLWGRGRSPAGDDVRVYEESVLKAWQSWQLALEHSGLKQERRALATSLDDLSWSWQDLNLTLNFSLPPGSYATSMLRELAILRKVNPEPIQNLVV